MKALALLCALAMFAGADARADDVSPDLACKFDHAVNDVASFDVLPKPVTDFLRPRLGEMAKRGEYFNATDVVMKPAPSRRFIRAGRSGDKWFLWYEHGGIAYNRNIVVLSWRPGDAAAILIAHTAYSGESPCRQTDAILEGHIPPHTGRDDWW
jgi:hypothetical protein